MGLDGVELVMEVEEHFGVSITDEEAGDIRTVGDLLNLLEGRVAKREASACLTLPWFLKLRGLVREAASDRTLRFRTGDTLVQVLSGRQRRRLWKGLSQLLRTTPTPLRRPQGLRVAFGLLALTWLVVGFVGFTQGSGPSLVTHLALGAALIAVYLATEPLRSYPPEGYKTFGEITRRLVGLEAATIGFPAQDPSLLLEELSLIISEQLGVERDEVVPEARFVEDLNLE